MVALPIFCLCICFITITCLCGNYVRRANDRRTVVCRIYISKIPIHTERIAYVRTYLPVCMCSGYLVFIRACNYWPIALSPFEMITMFVTYQLRTIRNAHGSVGIGSQFKNSFTIIWSLSIQN